MVLLRTTEGIFIYCTRFVVTRGAENQKTLYNTVYSVICELHRRYYQDAHFIPIVAVGQRGEINWSMVTCQGSTRSELP